RHTSFSRDWSSDVCSSDLERFGCDAVSYEPAARVAHLEVMSLREAYGKMFIYGRSRRRNIGGAMQRPLTSAQRAELVRQAVAGESGRASCRERAGEARGGG